MTKLLFRRSRKTYTLLVSSFSSTKSPSYPTPYILMYDKISMPVFSHKRWMIFLISPMKKLETKRWKEQFWPLLVVNSGEWSPWACTRLRQFTHRDWASELNFLGRFFAKCRCRRTALATTTLPEYDISTEWMNSLGRRSEPGQARREKNALVLNTGNAI